MVFAENEQVIIIKSLNSLTQQTITTETIVLPPSEPVVETTSAKKKFSFDAMNCSLVFPATWTFDASSGDFRLVATPKNGDDITITLRAYPAVETITASTVYHYRGGAVWDRWDVLASKHLSYADALKLGVSEKISAVYRRQELTEDLSFYTTISAEDVYVKEPNLVYIVTAKAHEDTWKRYSKTIKDILNSFIVQEGL